MAPIVAYPDALVRYRIMLRDADGSPLACGPDNPLEVVAWAGDDQAPAPDVPVAIAFELDANAVSLAPAGSTIFTVDCRGIARPEPGVYALRITVDRGDGPEVGFDGHLEVVNAPGPGTPPRTYASHDEMRNISDAVDALFPRDSGLAAFLEERGDAADEIERRIVDGPCTRPGFVFRHTSAFDPIYGYDRPDATLAPPDRDGIRALLAAGKLVVDDRLRELASILAAALVLERQITGGRNSYQEEAAALRARFDAGWMWYRPRLRVVVSEDPAELELFHGTATYFGLPEVP